MARDSSSLAAWARRESLLVSALAAGAAVAALSVPLKLAWLTMAGGALAAAGAIIRAGIAWRRSRLEARREALEAQRRLRVPVQPVGSVNPSLIGVDRAAQSILAGAEVPEYVPRNIDGELSRAIDEATDGTGPWLVIVAGRSKVGKSRTLFEALARRTGVPSLQVVAPVDADAVRWLLDPASAAPMVNGPQVLWLNDLEPLLNQGLTFEMLDEWHAGGVGRIVVATLGGKQIDQAAGSRAADFATGTDAVLQHARQVMLEPTTSQELSGLRGTLTGADFDSVERHGLAAYLVAAPRLQFKLTTGQHEPGDPDCAEGRALVRATVDWARCGRTDPISASELRELWPSYLEPGRRPSDGSFDGATEWATKPVAGTIALVQAEGDGFAPFDYVVRLERDRIGVRPPAERAWQAAISSSTGLQALAVGLNAYLSGLPEVALQSFDRAHTEAPDQVAAMALHNKGVTLGELGRREEEVSAYTDIDDRYRDDPTPALRELVAKALYNKAVALGELGRPEDEIAAYTETDDRYRDDPTPALRELLARALYNKAVTLGELDRPAEELAAYTDIDDRYRDDPTPTMREPVAAALVNKGVTLGRLARLDDALDVFTEVGDRYRDDPTPALRKQVAKALYNKGVTLGELGRPAEAVTAYTEVDDRYRDDPAPAMRARVAIALVNRGATLGQLGRLNDALASLAEVDDRYRNDPTPALREHVAAALVNKAATLGLLGRPADALATLTEADARYRDDPALRDVVSLAREALRRLHET